MQTPEEFLGVSASTQSPEDFLEVSSSTQSPEDYLADNSTQDPWGSFVQQGKKIAQEENFPASVLLGQAQIESGSGKHAPGHNYFGIKGRGTAGSNSLGTSEFENGAYHPQTSSFRAYNSPEESIRDYVRLVKSYPGVPEALATGSPAKVIAAIKTAGYATSPTYIQTVMNSPAYKENQ